MVELILATKSNSNSISNSISNPSRALPSERFVSSNHLLWRKLLATSAAPASRRLQRDLGALDEAQDDGRAPFSGSARLVLVHVAGQTIFPPRPPVSFAVCAPLPVRIRTGPLPAKLRTLRSVFASSTFSTSLQPLSSSRLRQNQTATTTSASSRHLDTLSRPKASQAPKSALTQPARNSMPIQRPTTCQAASLWLSPPRVVSSGPSSARCRVASERNLD